MTALVEQQTEALSRALSISGAPGELMAVLKATAFKGQVSDAQMVALLVVANQYKLNPWTKEIYAFPDRQNGIVPVVGVDGWSRIINTDPAFDGMDFEQDDESCTCVIYRKDRSHPIRVTEYMSECRRDVGPWKSHPKRMLRHKAMIQCSRIAFGFVGIYDQDEAERIVDGEYAVLKQTRPGVAATERAIPADSPERDKLIADMMSVADGGIEALKAAWGDLDKDKRQLIADRMESLKARATIADTAEVL